MVTGAILHQSRIENHPDPVPSHVLSPPDPPVEVPPQNGSDRPIAPSEADFARLLRAIQEAERRLSSGDRSGAARALDKARSEREDLLSRFANADIEQADGRIVDLTEQLAVGAALASSRDAADRAEQAVIRGDYPEAENILSDAIKTLVGAQDGRNSDGQRSLQDALIGLRTLQVRYRTACQAEMKIGSVVNCTSLR
jgi:hypothetical protein